MTTQNISVTAFIDTEALDRFHHQHKQYCVTALSHSFLQSVAPWPGLVPQLNLIASSTSTTEGGGQATSVVIESSGDSSSVRAF